MDQLPHSSPLRGTGPAPPDLVTVLQQSNHHLQQTKSALQRAVNENEQLKRKLVPAAQKIIALQKENDLLKLKNSQLQDLLKKSQQSEHYVRVCNEQLLLMCGLREQPILLTGNINTTNTTNTTNSNNSNNNNNNNNNIGINISSNSSDDNINGNASIGNTSTNFSSEESKTTNENEDENKDGNNSMDNNINIMIENNNFGRNPIIQSDASNGNNGSNGSNIERFESVPSDKKEEICSIEKSTKKIESYCGIINNNVEETKININRTDDNRIPSAIGNDKIPLAGPCINSIDERQLIHENIGNGNGNGISQARSVFAIGSPRKPMGPAPRPAMMSVPMSMMSTPMISVPMMSVPQMAPTTPMATRPRPPMASVPMMASVPVAPMPPVPPIPSMHPIPDMRSVCPTSPMPIKNHHCPPNHPPCCQYCQHPRQHLGAMASAPQVQVHVGPRMDYQNETDYHYNNSMKINRFAVQVPPNVLHHLNMVAQNNNQIHPHEPYVGSYVHSYGQSRAQSHVHIQTPQLGGSRALSNSMKMLSLPKHEFNFINKMKESFLQTESLLILGEMDFSLASAIADIMSTRYKSKIIKAHYRKYSQFRKTSLNNSNTDNNKYINVYATSYHNCVPVNRILQDGKFSLNYQIGLGLFHIFGESNIPNYNENSDLISTRVNQFQIEEEIKLSICNIINKTNLQWHIACGIDATNLDKYKLFENKKFDKIIFGFPRTKLPYDSANEQFMKKVLNCVKNFLTKDEGELHLLMHTSGNNGSYKTQQAQFETWKVLGDNENNNHEWTLVIRKSMSLDTLKLLFNNYQTRTESGYKWKPDTVEYIVLKPKFKRQTGWMRK